MGDAIVYMDSRGWAFWVCGEIYGYKAKYYKPGSAYVSGVRTLPWRKTAEDAQWDLDEYAEKHKMRRVNFDDIDFR